MTDLTIRDIFDLPLTIPRCIVKIQDFDDAATLQENIRDYVITDAVAAEMERLVERIVASCVRHEAGEGHYLHGSFGSGKSHFMAILGLILENNPAVWTKAHLVIHTIQDQHGAWLAENPILVVPVYMLGQGSLRIACYNAVNARLAYLGQPVCEFSDADKVIAGFRAEAERYGAVVYEKFQEATGFGRSRFDKMAAADQEQRDELARQILAYRDPSRAERDQLYPDKFSDGMATLTRHVRARGFAGIVFLIDELILYLGGKSGSQYMDEFNDLVALADNSALDRAAPLWVIVAKQRNIAETVPDDSSQQRIFEAMEHHKDRFPETTELADTELVPIVQERVLRLRAGMGPALERAVSETLDELSESVRVTLLHDLSVEDFQRVYPFHPALIRTLIDVTARLSRERAAIRLLYELLIERYPELPIGALLPYAALFDAVFLSEGLTGGSRNEELLAVQETYYKRLAPLIAEIYGVESDVARRAQLVVKTVLLCGLSKTLRSDITVERILHLNYQDLRGRTPFGSQQAIAQILTELDNRSELVRFTPNVVNPGLGVASITLAAGAQLADVLKRVPINWRQRLDAFTGLLKGLFDQPIQSGEIPNYERVWRGSRRRGRVRFANVAELSTNDMTIAANDVFTLFIDYPFEADAARPRGDVSQVLARARALGQAIPVGFWLPEAFTPDDLRDLEEYTRILELEAHPGQYLEEYGRTQRDTLETKLAGQKATKARTLRERLTQVYKGPAARVTFLDPAITPSLDAESLGAALHRIADAVCDRLYPHHPRFATEINQRALGNLLNDFLVPAALGGGSVPRTLDLDGSLTRLGIPLELAEQGAQSWILRPQSRYLAKLDELATGRQVQADKVREGLVKAFGFNRELCELFLLYLIRAQGFRPLRNEQPVTEEVNFGGLQGLVLERGRRLAAHEWAQAKEFAQAAWGVEPAVAELTVAAQDRLWRQLNAAASGARRDLTETGKQLATALEKAQVAAGSARRLAVLEAATALNALALAEDRDPYDGLRALLSWEPNVKNVTRAAAAEQLARRQQTHKALQGLQTDTLGRIITLAQGGNAAAQAAWDALREFIAAPEAEKELASHVKSWAEGANAVIDAALTTPAVPVVSATPAPDALQVSQPPASVVCDKAGLHIRSVQAVVGEQAVPLDADAVAPLVGRLQAHLADGSEIVIRIIVAEEKA